MSNTLLTKEQRELVQELFNLKINGDLYPVGLRGPNWANIERYKEIKKILGVDI